jgi:regulator of protease activity HflC (stomatin/prohibitin superfamily)
MWTTIKKMGNLAKATGLAATLGVIEMVSSKRGRRLLAVLTLTVLTVGVVLARPIRSIPAGTAAVRINRLTGGMTILDEGWALAIPGVHEMRTYPLHDQVYRPGDAIKTTGSGAFQSVEGLSLGIDVSVRWALDPQKMSKAARLRPDELEHDLVQPTVDGALHRAFAQHTVREIFATSRAAIQKGLEDELRTELGADGVVIKAVAIGSVDLPQQYKAGLEALLSEELSAEKMRYTLELEEKRIKQSELAGEADKVRREKAAAAAGAEQIIAAKSQAEAMQTILPLKEKEIEQRRLEAEAAKVVRLKQAEGEADAHRIEAGGEADARRKLADSDAYRLDVTGKATTAQMEREAKLLKGNPLLIQKTLADKLSDKISVIIAPPNTNGFFASGLLGTGQPAPAAKDEGGE